MHVILEEMTFSKPPNPKAKVSVTKYLASLTFMQRFHILAAPLHFSMLLHQRYLYPPPPITYILIPLTLEFVAICQKALGSWGCLAKTA